MHTKLSEMGGVGPAGMGYWSGALVALMPKFSLFWLTVSPGIDPVPEFTMDSHWNTARSM